MSESTVSELVRYPVTVTGEHADDYSKLFVSLLEKGNYGYKNPNVVPANFPGECISQFEAVLFNPNRYIVSEDVLKELDQMDLRPATMLELLAFGAKYPETQLECYIVTLAQFWMRSDNHRYVGYLGSLDDERGLGLKRVLDGLSGAWGEHWLFLAVPSKPLVA